MKHVHIVLEEIAALKQSMSDLKELQSDLKQSNISVNHNELKEYLIALEKSSRISVSHNTSVTNVTQPPLTISAIDLFKNISATPINNQVYPISSRNKYIADYTEWVKQGLAHACNEAVNISSFTTRTRSYTPYSNPPSFPEDESEDESEDEYIPPLSDGIIRSKLIIFINQQREWIKQRFHECSNGALNHSTVDRLLNGYPNIDL